ncbi:MULTISPECIES: transcriptional regulator NrdR [Anaerotruncus]|uniref:Transcriptional repressor NrdR n=2 Tax=Anaerotruncus TaxID=244127 RepID=A0A498D596_9FIRM|nr:MULTISPECIES: transcriptional regulator NrdR [Anaerotruncus]MBC3937666.1 transcriptional repressor NrdR [Anaerotruncus massiliensis (ex Togo et al. 2019)]MCQ4895809.1 transcriptional regulator NrdR [Anaerotruncus sp. DFI.9.16]RLL14771.1 transcriptional repressor NrdR [Anaerotruncus massiliensis (ex Liu et al. 2021)]
MKCPYCGYVESKVIDSRPTDESERIRRRRECIKCGRRFTTYEVIETTPLIVIKKDKSREEFDSGKVLGGMVRACEKRPVPLDVLEEAVRDIEMTLRNSLEKEVPSYKIGELAMEKLRGIDEVAYVRFASVYRQFKDIDSFMKELQTLLSSRDGDGK